MMHIVVGLFMIALGVWGVMDEWYYAVDCIKAAGSLALLAGGLMGLVGGVLGNRRRSAKPKPECQERTQEMDESSTEIWIADRSGKRASERLKS